MRARHARVARSLAAAAFLTIAATEARAQITPTPDESLAAHIARRLTFGAHKDDVGALLANPPQSMIDWFNDQIDPFNSIPDNDPDYLALLDDIGGGAPIETLPFGDPDLTADNLQRDTVARALFSKRQFLEKHTYFLEIHFNTNASAVGSKAAAHLSGVTSTAASGFFERNENSGLRANAFGDFRDLLEVSAKGTAMLFYLDSYTNVATGGAKANENYARELLELHTFGVDFDTGAANVYVEADIDEVALAFSGWHVNPNPPYAFLFDSGSHADSTAMVFTSASNPVAPLDLSLYTGQAQGEAVLDYLSTHPTTGAFLAQKLYNYYVAGGKIPANREAACVTAWTNSGGNMEALLRAVLVSFEFLDPATSFWRLVETPLERMTSTVRAYDGSATTSSQLNTFMRRLDRDLGQDLFFFPSPDGFPTASADQVSTGQNLHAINFVEEIGRGFVSFLPAQNYVGEISYNPVALLNSYGVNAQDQDVVLDFLFLILYQNNLSLPQDYALAKDFIEHDSAGNPSTETFATLVAAGNFQEYAARITWFFTFMAALPQAFQK